MEVEQERALSRRTIEKYQPRVGKFWALYTLFKFFEAIRTLMLVRITIQVLDCINLVTSVTREVGGAQRDYERTRFCDPDLTDTGVSPPTTTLAELWVPYMMEQRGSVTRFANVGGWDDPTPELRDHKTPNF